MRFTVVFALFLSSIWIETFDKPKLDLRRWNVTAESDFRERVADVLGARLRLRADTIGTNDSTVKFLGVRSTKKFQIGKRGAVSVDLDWNNQANGSYLSGSLILSPNKTSANPLNESDWLSIEYVGVPPGQNARLFISSRMRGLDQQLYTEGWPEVNRAGRKISAQTISLALSNGAVQVSENGRIIYDSKMPVLSFDDAYIYLQMSSHSNYQAREIYFDNVRVVSND